MGNFKNVLKKFSEQLSKANEQKPYEFEKEFKEPEITDQQLKELEKKLDELLKKISQAPDHEGFQNSLYRVDWENLQLYMLKKTVDGCIIALIVGADPNFFDLKNYITQYISTFLGLDEEKIFVFLEE